jgi:hypothetical protein
VAALTTITLATATVAAARQMLMLRSSSAQNARHAAHDSAAGGRFRDTPA